MFGFASSIKYIVILLIIVAIGGGLWYITDLKANLAIAKQNEEKLQEGIAAQQRVIEGMQQDIKDIQAANATLTAQADQAREEIKSLTDRFNVNARGESRDFGAIAAEKPRLIERLINRGTDNALRCLELASGAEHTESELNAKKTSETNRECPAIANPNYISTTP